MDSIFFVVILFGIAATRASPTLVPRQSITSLVSSQIDGFSPYTHYASAAYCTPATTLSWSCGVNCNSNPSFKPVASGGNGDGVQYWYVGYDTNLREVIVAHQGTNPSEILAVVTDGDILLGSLDSSLFPGLPADIRVHSGFRNEQSKTASDVLSSVQDAMSKYGASSVTLVGHSLGAALALLDSLYLPLHLPPGTTFQTIVYGLPRVGNQAFADYVDSNLRLTHINNMKDPVPTVPTMFFGYVHPRGEVHIRETGEWVACPGQDNPSNECIVGDVPDLFASNLANHNGPYNGIKMHCSL